MKLLTITDETTENPYTVKAKLAIAIEDKWTLTSNGKRISVREKINKIIIQHLHDFRLANYPQDLMYSSSQDIISLAGTNQDCMKKIVNILVDVNSISNEIFNLSLENNKLDFIKFGEALNIGFQRAVLNNTLSKEETVNKRKNKI